MYKIIYPSITKEELADANEQINHWFETHRDTDSLREQITQIDDQYSAASHRLRKSVISLTVFFATSSILMSYDSNIPIDISMIPMILAFVTVTMAIILENKFHIIYAQRQFDCRIKNDTLIPVSDKCNPLKFTMYEMSEKSFILHDFSGVKRVHVYSDILEKLLWLQKQNISTADDLVISDDKVEFCPMAGRKRLVPLIFDKNVVSIYGSTTGDIIDLSKLKDKLLKDIKSLK